MKKGLYFNLAVDGIRKNKRMYFPYILTCIGMVMMYYIIVFLQTNETISGFKGGDNAQLCLSLGSIVIAFFAVIFLFYTNSFLIRRRKKEFGLYNILGMNRRNIGRVLFLECLIVGAVSLAGGLLIGILLSKFAELALLNMLKMELSYKFIVSKQGIFQSLILFGIIFLLLYLNGLRQVRFSGTLELLGSERKGEKPPKGNWFLGILGLVILIVAYYTAVNIKNPLDALATFFVAVIMVIAATYLLMVSGSVLFCRLLQKNKKFYYKKANFVSVSSMVYRMKRNGAGLASICILATMVLVMLSSSSCLYFGSEDAIKTQYPYDINVSVYDDYGNDECASDECYEKVRDLSYSFAEKYGTEIIKDYYYKAASVAGVFKGNVFVCSMDEDKMRRDLSTVVMVNLVSLSDFNAATNDSYELEDGEALVYMSKGNYGYDELIFDGGNTYKVKGIIEDDVIGLNGHSPVDAAIVVLNNITAEALGEFSKLQNESGQHMLTYSLEYGFDIDLPDSEKVEFARDFRNEFPDREEIGGSRNYINGREENREDFFSTFGGLFYLGIILSVIFIFAAALIIYYKQVSEGYEDQARFDIMQKVGMTKKEIRESINSQMLTVFFFPLAMSGVHTCFAFPMIKKMLYIFNLYNDKLFIITSVISFVCFAAIYVILYRVTSNAYFNIVSSKVAE